jgi:hypothetical protein
MLVRLWLFNFGGRMVLPLRPESEVTSEQESKAKDGDLFSAERSATGGRSRQFEYLVKEGSVGRP